MREYRRPRLSIEPIFDAAGDLIPYGSRYWGTDDQGEELEPPSDVYSACLHPERFEPVAVVGRAIVDYLVATYAIERTDSLAKGRTETRLTPTLGDGTPLTFVFGTQASPSVKVRAGWRFEGRWPDCGCDACDEDVKDLLDELEDTVLTIVEGGMSEWRSGPDPSSHLYEDDDGNPIGDEHIPWEVHMKLEGRVETEGSGWSSSEPEPTDMPWEPHRWPAWPRSDDDA